MHQKTTASTAHTGDSHTPSRRQSTSHPSLPWPGQEDLGYYILYVTNCDSIVISIALMCRDCDIDFYYAISPGLDITYSNAKEVACLKRKLDQVGIIFTNIYTFIYSFILITRDRCCWTLNRTKAHEWHHICSELLINICPQLTYLFLFTLAHMSIVMNTDFH